MSFALQLKIESFDFDSRSLFHHTSFSVSAGEKVFITGESGCGKSTLLRLLIGLESLASGSLLLNSQPVNDIIQLRKQVIFVRQTPFFWSGSVSENLQMGFSFHAHSAQPYSEKKALELLEMAGLQADIITKPVDKLSGGEQQRLSLVRAMLLQPTCLLLDEPTASLDAKNTQRIEDIIGHWIEEDSSRSFVWISHSEQQIARLNSKVCNIANHQITTVGHS